MIKGVEKISEYCYKIPKETRGDMLVDGIVYSDESLFETGESSRALEQVANVATLPGIVKASFAMPDIHLGYGFPIGGVAAMDEREGFISPGGVGFDISCGVRLLKTKMLADEVRPSLKELMGELSRNIPKGLGREGKISLSQRELEDVLEKGIEWAQARGFVEKGEEERIEEGGRTQGADPSAVSKRAFQRGAGQLGTLGSGNHFLEVQEVVEIFDPLAAKAFGIFKGQLNIMIHSGSRGLGHQVCTDYVKIMNGVVKRIGLLLPDRQLACAPIGSPEGKAYFGAMAAAANYAMVNRALLAHWAKESLSAALKKTSEEMGIELLYDVSHNLAKFEKHEVDGVMRKLCVHRKGATRAFGPNLLPEGSPYKNIGQPVMIPGDMGRASYVLLGTDESEERAFSSTCHGAGRIMSRTEAKKKIGLGQLREELERRGIIALAGHAPSLPEEAPAAYKDVDRVTQVCEGAGLSRRVAKLKPLGVIKG